MLGFARPAVGTRVKVTTKHDFLARWGNYPIKVSEGVVIANQKWQDPNTFALATGKSTFPIAVISLDVVTDIVDLDKGQIGQVQVAVEPKFLTFSVKGSKPGTSYMVTKSDQGWTCDCPGFTFRRNCRHINEQKELLLKKKS